MDKLEQIFRHLKLLNSLRTRVRSRSVITPVIVDMFDQLIAEKPCALVRIALESAMFEQKDNDTLFFGEESWAAFLQREVSQQHPFIKNFSSEQVWQEFFEKYQLMTREFLMTCLRNTSRQHRGAKRFCRDLQILISEGNYTDETILQENRLELRKHNTVGLLLSIKMTLTTMIRYLN